MKERTEEQLKIIDSITLETDWGFKKLKQESLAELLDIADAEGTEWGETVRVLIDCYLNLPYGSDEIKTALYNELVDAYLFMLENTQVITTPEQTITKVIPAKTERVWTDC